MYVMQIKLNKRESLENSKKTLRNGLIQIEDGESLDDYRLRLAQAPKIAGDFNAIDWPYHDHIVDLVKRRLLAVFLENQPKLLDFFKQNFIFETLITHIMDEKIESEFDYIKDIKDIHPHLNLNTQYFFEGDSYEDETIPHDGRIQYSKTNIISLSYAITSIESTLFINSHGADFLGAPENSENIFDDITKKDLAVILREDSNLYFKAIQKFENGVMGYRPFLWSDAKEKIKELHSIIGHHDMHFQWSLNTIDAQLFVDTINKEEDLTSVDGFVEEFIYNNRNALNLKLENEHPFKNKTIRELIENSNLTLSKQLILKIDKEINIQNHLETKKTKPKQPGRF